MSFAMLSLEAEKLFFLSELKQQNTFLSNSWKGLMYALKVAVVSSREFCVGQFNNHMSKRAYAPSTTRVPSTITPLGTSWYLQILFFLWWLCLKVFFLHRTSFFGQETNNKQTFLSSILLHFASFKTFPPFSRKKCNFPQGFWFWHWKLAKGILHAVQLAQSNNHLNGYSFYSHYGWKCSSAPPWI